MRKEALFIGLLFLAVALFFFKPVLKGFVPFPGDLLVSEFNPYRAYSFSGYLPGSVPNKGMGQDVVRILYPWKYFTIQEIKQGRLPFWNPYNFSGNPHLANLQSGVLYPANLLFFIFPFNTGWTLYIMLAPLLALVFTYLFLRYIGLSKAAACMGGIAFAFSGFMVSWLEYGNFDHTFLWLPASLLLIESYLKTPRATKLLLLASIFTISLFAGYVQLFMYLYCTSVAYALYRVWRERKRLVSYKNVLLLFAFAAPFFLGAVVLFPLFEIFQNSARNSYTFEQLGEKLIPLKNLVTIFIPDFFGNQATRSYFIKGTYIERASYIGVAPLFFALLSWRARARGNVLFFVSVALISYFSALDILPVRLFHTIGIPFLSTGVPSRILSLFCFSLAVLSAFGFHYFLSAKKTKELYTSLGVIFLCALFIVGYSWVYVLAMHNADTAVTQRNLILPSLFLAISGVLFLLKKKVSQTILIVAFLTLSIVDLFYFFQKITPFSPREFIYPATSVISQVKKIQGIDRTWGYGTAFIDADLHMQEKIYGTDGYDPLFIKRYAELISTSHFGEIPPEIPRTDVNIFPGFGNSDLRNNSYRQRILDIAGVRYILHKSNQRDADYSTFPEEFYRLVWNQDGWHIYENKNALPRVFLAKEYITLPNDRKIIHALFNPDTDLKKTVVLEKRIARFTQGYKNGTVELLTYGSTAIAVKTRADGDGILLLSDNFFPGWKAYVDGRQTPLYRANYAFRGVYIPSGNHTVTFAYYPASFDLGLKVSTVTLFVLAIFSLFATIKLKRYV